MNVAFIRIIVSREICLRLTHYKKKFNFTRYLFGEVIIAL